MSDGKFVISQATNGQWFFNLVAKGNGQKVLHSETYVAKASAESGIASVRVNAPYDARYNRLTSQRSLPYFVLRAANGEIIGRSEEYSSVAARDQAIEWVKANAPGAPIV